MKREGIAIVLSAPSGTGKSTLSHMLLSEFPNCGYSISCTTRPMRASEQDGIDYHFVSADEFARMRDEGEFAEWAEVHGNFYGTPLGRVQQLLRDGRDILFDIDVQGAAQLKASLPDAVLVFVLPPSMKELELRLRKRGQDDEASIGRRLKNARKEIGEALWYDALVLNDDLERAYADLRAVYIAASLAAPRNGCLIDMLLAEDGPGHA